MKENGVELNFIQDDISVSHKNVLRGIHGDNKLTPIKPDPPVTSKFFFISIIDLYLTKLDCYFSIQIYTKDHSI